MKAIRKWVAMCAVLTVLVMAGITATSAETVEFNFLDKITYSINESSSRWIENEDGSFTAVPGSALSTSGSAIIYIPSTAYKEGWLLEYDIDYVATSSTETMYFTFNTWGENRFLNGEKHINLTEKLTAVAGVEPIMVPDDYGVERPQLPGGHYTGIIDLSEFIEPGFDQFSHIAAWYQGESMTISKFRFVSGTEASPTIVPTTTTEATTTTTEAPTTTKTDAVGTTTKANTDDNGGLSAGAIVGIVAGAVVVIGGGVAAVVLVSKKKKKQG